MKKIILLFLTIWSLNLYGQNPVQYYYDAAGNRIKRSPVTVLISVKVLLHGPYNVTTDLMNDQLRTKNLIPLTEPYTDLPAFTHLNGGGEKVSAATVFDNPAPEDDIVDWVFVEIRDKNNPEVVVSTASGLIQRDGDIVDTDGISPLKIIGNPDDYFIAVRHRNHLGVRSTTAISLNKDVTTTYDFTDSAAKAYSGQQYMLEAGKYGIYSGNANGNSAISLAYSQVRMTGPTSINDYLQLTFRLGGIYTNIVYNVYETEDINMDGNVRMTGPFQINDYLILFSNLDGLYTNILTRTF